MKRNFIGGTDVAAILGLSQYRTPYEVWDEKKNGNNPFTGNQFTEWGTRLEPVIIQKFQDDNDVEVVDNNKKFIHSDHPFLGCHPDGLFEKKGETRLLEVKTVGSNAFKHWGNDVPLEYYCQIQHNMMITNTKKAVLAYFVLDTRLYDEIEINFDQEFVTKQTAFLVEWWSRYIDGDEIPTKVVADYEKDSPEKSIIEADDDAINAYENLLTIKDKIKGLTDLKETYENTLKEKIGEHTEMMHGLDTIATWRPSVRVSLNSKKLKEEEPDTFLKYAKETNYRSFLIKQPKS